MTKVYRYFIIMLAFLSLSYNASASISGGTTIYLDNGGSSLWGQGGAWFAAYFFTGTTTHEWVKLSLVDTETQIYSATIPSGTWDNVIFVRMNPAYSTMDWSGTWNQTDDLTPNPTYNMFTITDWGTTESLGYWSNYTPKYVYLSEAYNVTAVCSDNGGLTFTPDLNSPQFAVSGPAYKCRQGSGSGYITDFTIYYPSFYYIKISKSGDLSFSIKNTGGQDVDYIIWGPFDTPEVKLIDLSENKIDMRLSPNNRGGNNPDCYSCGFSSYDTETAILENAVQGKYYILMISNFGQTADPITITADPSSIGASDCSIVNGCDITKADIKTTNIQYTAGTYTVEGDIYFNNAPTSGTLTVTDVTSGKTAITSAPFASPWSFNIPSIITDAGNLPRELSVSFSAGNCDNTYTYTSPSSPQTHTVCTDAGSLVLNENDPQSYLYAQWSPTSQLSDPNIVSPTFFIPTTAGEYYYTFEGKRVSHTKIVNGDFEQGNIGFTTTYTYKTGDNAVFQENTYCIAPKVLHNSSTCTADHTTGIGNMMSANGSAIAGATVWEQTGIMITPNTDYIFYAWVMCWDEYCRNPAKLQFSINGDLQGGTFTPSGTCVWKQIYTIWNSGNSSTASIKLENQQTAGFGNDFSVDDISFSEVLSVSKSFHIVVKDCQTPIEPTIHDTTYVCIGNNATLTAQTTGETYQWDSGETTSSITVPITEADTTTHICTVGMQSLEILAEEHFPVIGRSCDFDLSVTGTQNTICSGSATPGGTSTCNGTATATPNGGTAPYTYQWNDPLAQTTAIASGLCAGEYTIVATDKNGQTAQASVTITTFEGYHIVEGEKTICQGESYLFDGKELTEAGIYTAQLKTIYGCDSLVTLYLSVTSLGNAEITGNTEICSGSIVTLSVTGATEGINYYWSGAQAEGSTESSITFSPNASGPYSVRISKENCAETLDTTVTVYPNPRIIGYEIGNENVGKVIVLAQNGTLPYTYSLENGNKSYNGIFEKVSMGYHTVTISDANQCIDDSIFHLQVLLKPEIYFSPDGDNNNDTWDIENIELLPSHVTILDRFGKVVAKWDNDFTGWDGKYRGQPLPSTDYWYIIRDIATGESISGHFTLFRTR
ncbi:MAG: T9SS type B sorting domain-containing protein [Bacteroidia bacterium]|nr:T9SS type B sorting domain-containing protein [Bacteroidia bacterium]